MSREVITTSILLIASVVAVSVVIMTMIPSIRDLSNSYTSVSVKLNEKVTTDIEIIFVKASSSDDSKVKVTLWVKNTGRTLNLALVEKSDLFISSSLDFVHLTLKDCYYNIENGDGDEYWEKGETLKIVTTDLTISRGEYEVTLVLYNGVKATDYFSW